jgi:hypothetical protein
MRAGVRLAFALSMLGVFASVSGAATMAAPDTIATQVQTLLHANYARPEKLAVVDRVFAIEKRLGAYRAALTQQQLVYRLNADLWVATRDRRVSVHEQFEPLPAGSRRYALGQGLQLYVPRDGDRGRRAED